MERSVYDAAGGSAALVRLAAVWHRRCLQDPVVSHAFSHPGLHPQHVERLGRPDAQDLAVTFLPMVEGAALLADNLRDPELLSRQICRLEEWMDSLADR